MKRILIILLTITFASCSPFISKGLRKKNKCNRKVERINTNYQKKIIKLSYSCPEALIKDTIRDTLTIEIPEVKIDTFFIIQKDTAEIDSLLNLIKNKKTRSVVKEYITNYIPLKDTITHEIDGYTFKFFNHNGNIGYSVDRPAEIIEKASEIVISRIEKIELTLWEKIMNLLNGFWWWILISFIVFMLLLFLYKRLFLK